MNFRLFIKTILFSGIISGFLLSDAVYCEMLKEIEIQTPKYLKRKTRHWEKQSRIIGEIKNATEVFTIEISSSSDSGTVISEEHNGNLSIYETAWIAPGVYNVAFTAKGYLKQKLKKVKVDVFSDCVINVVFGKTAYRRD